MIKATRMIILSVKSESLLSLIMERSTQVIGKGIKDTAKANKNGKTEPLMKVAGRMIKLMDMEFLDTFVVTSMKATGSMTKPMDKVSSLI